MIRTARKNRALLGAVTGLTLSLVAAGCGTDDEVDDAAVETATDDVAIDETETTPPAETETTPEDETTPEGEDTEIALEGAEAGELRATLNPLNESGATGVAQVEVTEDGQVLVTVQGEDLAADAPHAQHIHIGGENTCPTMEEDAGDDGVLTTPEGQPAYGEIAVSLTTEGDVGPGSGLAVERFPVADGEGTVTYSRTFELPEGTTVEDVSNGVIVVHGVADSPLGEDPDAYDGPDSELKEGVPAEATLPALCGVLEGTS